MKNLGKVHKAASLMSGNIFLTLLLFVLVTSTMKGQQLWSEIQLKKNSVYPGEPIEVSVFVYTSTWFTAGVNPGNIKVNNASTVYFRSVSTSKSVKGKTFSGVQLIFNVFPFEPGNLIFPSLSIEVETPPDGDYKGVKRTVKTKERMVKVMPIPPGIEQEDWLVTTKLSVKEVWSGNLNDVKVGDVLERKITRNAQNTISSLIPFIVWDTIPSISLYPKSPSTENVKTKTSISANSTETMRYLFEKEGEIRIPEMVLFWWHPYQKRLYKKTLPAKKIMVAANPDGQLLASIADSLQTDLNLAEAATGNDEETLSREQKKNIVIAVFLVLFGILLSRLLVKALSKYKVRREKYLQSELHSFKQLVSAVGSTDSERFEQLVYKWIDRLDLSEPSYTNLIRQAGRNGYDQDLNLRFDQLTKAQWKKIRSAIRGELTKQSVEINP